LAGGQAAGESVAAQAVGGNGGFIKPTAGSAPPDCNRRKIRHEEADEKWLRK
jgi:hypothetical protein